MLHHLFRLDPAIFTLLWIICISLLAPSHFLISRWTNEKRNRIAIPFGLCFSVCGAVFFIALFRLFVHVLSNRKTAYLTKYQIFDISNKAVSIIQAVISTTVGLFLYWNCCDNSNSFIVPKSSHFVCELYVWFGMPYFFYDIWSMLRVFRLAPSPNKSKDKQRKTIGAFVRKESVMIGHHVLAGTLGFLLVIVYQRKLGGCFYSFIYLMEISTPFVCLRQILCHLCLKKSSVYILNGIVMLLTFFWFRIRPLPLVLYAHASNTNQTFVRAFTTLPSLCQFGVAVLFIPQFYWFALMVRGAFKTFVKL